MPVAAPRSQGRASNSQRTSAINAEILSVDKSMESHMTDTALMELTRKQLRLAIALVGTMRPPMSPPGRPMCALFLTMVEQFEATARLMEVKLVTHAAVHVRGMLEALADFSALHQSATHLDVMIYKQLQGERRTYTRAIDSQMLSAPDLLAMKAKLAACDLRYETQKGKLTREQRGAKMEDVFKSAGLPELISMYTMLCSLAHNDLAALAMRHQGEQGMEMRMEVPLSLTIMVHTMAHYALISAVPVLNDIAKFRDGSFQTHVSAMTETHTQLLAECARSNGRGHSMGDLPGQPLAQ